MHYVSVKKGLIKYISNLEPNERIPSRSFICNKWKISRKTADKIIAELQREGIVYCVKGSGTFISSKRFDERKTVGNMTGRKCWAIVIPDLSYSIYPKAFAGIESFVRKNNINFVICQTDDDVDTEFAIIQREIASGIDGLIIVPAITTTENFRNYDYIVRSGVPFVFWQRSVDYMPNVPQMLLNGYYGGYIATKHLLDKGYRRIAYLAPKRFRSSMDRYMGYCAAIQEAGIKEEPLWVRIGLADHSARECARNMLILPNAPDAFVCYVDDLAAEVVMAIQDMGLRISDDVGVIGFEGVASWLEQGFGFGLTYVDINRYVSGLAAAQSLWALMTQEYPDIQTRIFVPSLCVRDTCCGKKEKEL